MVYNYVIDMYGDGKFYTVNIEAGCTKTALDKILLRLFKDVRYVGYKDNCTGRDNGNRRIADGVYIRRCRFVWNGETNPPLVVRKAAKVVAL